MIASYIIHLYILSISPYWPAAWVTFNGDEFTFTSFESSLLFPLSLRSSLFSNFFDFDFDFRFRAHSRVTGRSRACLSFVFSFVFQNPFRFQIRVILSLLFSLSCKVGDGIRSRASEKMQSCILPQTTVSWHYPQKIEEICLGHYVILRSLFFTMQLDPRTL